MLGPVKQVKDMIFILASEAARCGYLYKPNERRPPHSSVTSLKKQVPTPNTLPNFTKTPGKSIKPLLHTQQTTAPDFQMS